jgi:uncharacterized RDD family membrane protein YckC
VRQREHLILQLLIGIPVVIGYMLLAPVCKNLFHRMVFDSYARQPDAAGALVERLESAAEAPFVDAVVTHATVYASFGRRAAAHLADWFFLLIPALLLLGTAASMMNFDPNSNPSAATVIVVYGPPLLLFWLYRAVTLRGPRQGTWGMRLVGIFATDLQGRRLSFARASARHFASFVSFYVAYLGYLMQPFNARRQTLHDRLSGSVVLRRPPKG